MKKEKAFLKIPYFCELMNVWKAMLLAYELLDEKSLSVDNYDVTIMSRNIRHYWYRYNPEYTGEGTVIIFHKHKVSHPYHQHGRTNTLRQREGLRAMISGR